MTSSNRVSCHSPFTPVFNHPGCISLLTPKSPISSQLKVYLLSQIPIIKSFVYIYAMTQ